MKNIYKEELNKQIGHTLSAQVKINVNYVDVDDDETIYSISIEDAYEKFYIKYDVTQDTPEPSKEYGDSVIINDRREFKVGSRTIIILLHINLKYVTSYELKDLIKASDLIEEAIKLDEEGGDDE